MGKTKENWEKTTPINCTIKTVDLDMAKQLGSSNVSLGIRRAFEATRALGGALMVLKKIQQAPDRAAELTNDYFSRKKASG